MEDESHIPFEKQSLVFRLRKRAQIRRASTERKSVQEGRPDRVADLLEEAAREIEVLQRAAAPDLLAALTTAADRFDAYAALHLAKSPPDTDKAERNAQYAREARAAIAKATGADHA